MNIIGKKRIFLSISAILVLTSMVLISLFGFKPGIDFVGGTLWQIRFTEAVSREEVVAFFQGELSIPNAIVTEEGSGESFLIRLPEISEEQHQDYLTRLEASFLEPEELSFQTIGASVGKELRRKAITAFIMVLLGISLYIAFAFRKVSRPVASWKYGVITLLTLFHDAFIPAGLMALLGYLGGVEIDTNFIVALLVVMGFSVHDTIVVFDRIRENLKSFDPAKSKFEELVNTSVNQTIARSVNTSLTLVLVLVALYFFGGSSTENFALTLIIGIVAGTYSSIFLASPLLVAIERWQRRG